jgi:large subunit ribosomal protein L13
MKTFVIKKTDIQRKWYLVDAEGKTLGRIATEISVLLRGKNKPEFSPHLDIGDGVVVVNAEKVFLSGGKEEKKKYYSHSGYSGGMKEISVGKLREKKPAEIIRKAVSGMIPKNRLKKSILSRLRVFVGSEHTLSAQQPEPIL